jgi:hypothetical protein
VYRIVVLLTMTGCFGSGMESAAHRTGQNPRSDGVLDVAAAETGCVASNLRIVAETNRRYVNETAFRFILEGCGERFGYAEQCDLGLTGPGVVPVNDSLGCRYLLVTRVRLPNAP